MKETGKKSLGKIIYKWLFVLVAISFFVAAPVGVFVQNLLQQRQSFKLLREYIDDYEQRLDINGYIKDTFISGWGLTNLDDPELFELNKDNDKLKRSVDWNPEYVDEISLVDHTGTVAYSSDPDRIGQNIRDNELTADFMKLFEGKTDYCFTDCSDDPFSDNEGAERIYVGTLAMDPEYIALFGLNRDNVRFYTDISLWYSVNRVRIGEKGFMMACMSDTTVSGVTRAFEGDLVEVEVPYAGELALPENEDVITETIAEFYGQKCYVSMLKKSNHYVIAAYPVDEANDLRSEYNAFYVILFFIVLLILFILIYFVLKNRVVGQVGIIHRSLKKITAGDLDEKTNAEGSLEFHDLSAGINDTVDNLKDRIQAAKEQMAAEMENARKIQESAVPTDFPEHEAFGLYASMDTAEAVGGDFYDFFMTDENTLVIVMADVSGKGMPAALYMMRAKTLIKTYAEQGLPVEEVARETNLKLCEDASKDMFVTAWLGFLDIRTGVLSYVHAGHTLPVLIGSEISFVKQKINTVLGGLRKAKYLRQEITLSPGDSIYLYTDGVDEAHDKNGDMYGDERLLAFISKEAGTIQEENGNEYCKAVCEAVLSDVRDFAEGAPQYDDITMMCVSYNGLAG